MMIEWGPPQFYPPCFCSVLADRTANALEWQESLSTLNDDLVGSPSVLSTLFLFSACRNEYKCFAMARKLADIDLTEAAVSFSWETATLSVVILFWRMRLHFDNSWYTSYVKCMNATLCFFFQEF